MEVHCLEWLACNLKFMYPELCLTLFSKAHLISFGMKSICTVHLPRSVVLGISMAKIYRRETLAMTI